MAMMKDASFDNGVYVELFEDHSGARVYLWLDSLSPSAIPFQMLRFLNAKDAMPVFLKLCEQYGRNYYKPNKPPKTVSRLVEVTENGRCFTRLVDFQVDPEC